MKKKIIATPKAPDAIGPYSQGVIASGFLFTAGQIPLDPASGNIVKGTIQEQARRVMENLKAIVEESGSSMDKVVKTTIYLIDLSEFSIVNKIYGEYFKVNPPARATVQVASLPKGVLLEIDAIAVL